MSIAAPVALVRNQTVFPTSTQPFYADQARGGDGADPANHGYEEIARRLLSPKDVVEHARTSETSFARKTWESTKLMGSKALALAGSVAAKALPWVIGGVALGAAGWFVGTKIVPDLFNRGIQLITQKAIEWGGPVINVLQQATQGVKQAVVDGCAFIARCYKGFGLLVRDVWNWSIGNIGAALGSLWDGIKNGAIAIGSGISGLYRGIMGSGNGTGKSSGGANSHGTTHSGQAGAGPGGNPIGTGTGSGTGDSGTGFGNGVGGAGTGGSGNDTTAGGFPGAEVVPSGRNGLPPFGARIEVIQVPPNKPN